MRRLIDLLASVFGSLGRPNPIAPPAPPAVPDRPVAKPPTVTPLPPPGGFIDQLVDLHNTARANAGRPPLAFSAKLSAVTRDHAKWMASHRTLSHDEGVIPFDHLVLESGYRFAAVGQNIAAGQVTASQVFADWMADPPHRSAILSSDYTEFGIDYELSVDSQVYWCVTFGRPGGGQRPLMLVLMDLPPGIDRR